MTPNASFHETQNRFTIEAEIASCQVCVELSITSGVPLARPFGQGLLTSKFDIRCLELMLNVSIWFHRNLFRG